MLLYALNLRGDAISPTNIVQNEALAVKDTELAAKDVELEQALATAAAKVLHLLLSCFTCCSLTGIPTRAERSIGSQECRTGTSIGDSDGSKGMFLSHHQLVAA